MTPERLEEVKNKILFLTGDPRLLKDCEEWYGELKRLQTLPHKLEKRLGEIERWGKQYIQVDSNTIDSVVALVNSYREADLPWLTTTIRSMMAHIKQLEEIRDREGQENAITVAAMGEKNTELQAKNTQLERWKELLEQAPGEVSESHFR